MDEPSIVAVFVTTPDESVARTIARACIEKKLAACVNIVPKVVSIYTWNDQVEESAENLLVIKTTSSALPALEQEIKGMHPYDTPEFVAILTEYVEPRYRQWLIENVLPR